MTTPSSPTHDHLTQQAVPLAAQLVCAVRDDVTETHRLLLSLDGATRAEVHALLVVLAAMVPDDRTTADLLAWTTGKPIPADAAWTVEDLRKAHAARVRGKSDPWTVNGERVYQARRHQRRKARQALLGELVAVAS